VKDLAGEWSIAKPLDGQINYKQALETVGGFRIRFENLEKEGHLISLARRALGIISVDDQNADIKIVLEEIRDVEQVWLQLGQIWSELNVLRESHWSDLPVATLKSTLINTEDHISGLPIFIKQYSGYAYLEKRIQELKKINGLLIDLKSDFLRERHWFHLIGVLDLKVKYQQLGRVTLGQFWDSMLFQKESQVKEILNAARGEIILEDFLVSIRETWNNYNLSFVTFQGKCHLIRGWEELISTCKDHLASLASMSSSVYYGIFEEEASQLEKKLDHVFLVFDSWIEVQRQWVYLEGIFNGNAEIGLLLPMETSRFSSLNLEFIQLMGKVHRTMKVLDVVAIQDIRATLARFDNVFGVLQTALLQYLELQRAEFSRFFFVGDEDLLDIIGNAKDLLHIQKHLKKMFPGINSIQRADDDESTIVAVISPEGEILKLMEPVPTNPKRISFFLLKFELYLK
jgi:dynein heavy chain 1